MNVNPDLEEPEYRTALVAGAGGFIGGHLTKKLLERGYEVIATDIKKAEDWYQLHSDAEIVDDADLRYPANSFLSTVNVDHIFNLAADMGGMGFISSHRVDCMRSALITMNLLDNGWKNGVSKFFYASSACVYNDDLQGVTDVSLKEEDAWPALPEPGYGLEKLYGEQLHQFYEEEMDVEVRVARFHNIFGPYGTYDGGREKAPAAICRKVIEAKLSGKHEIDIWGDGEQTRSFLYVDECVEGIERLFKSDVSEPINLGSDELVSINDLVSMVEEFAGIKLKRNYQLDKPQGVRGRNSDNTLIKQKLAWGPSSKLVDGMKVTYDWIFEQMTSDNPTTKYSR